MLSELEKLLAYRNSWTLDPQVGRWTFDSVCWTLSLTVVEQNQNPVSDFTENTFDANLEIEIRNQIRLQATILDCSGTAVHSHPFSKISPEKNWW